MASALTSVALGDVHEETQREQLRWIDELLQQTIDNGILRLGIHLQHHVTAFPSYIGFARSVRDLRITNNVRLHIGELVENLTHLELHHNALTSLPDELTQLVRLTHLDVSHNRLPSLPHGMRRLRLLRHLDVSNNAIVHFPYDVQELELDTFEADDNPFLDPQTELRPPVAANAEQCAQCFGPMPLDAAGCATGHTYVAFRDFGDFARLPFVYYVCGIECMKDCCKMQYLDALRQAKEEAALEDDDADWDDEDL